MGPFERTASAYEERDASEILIGGSNLALWLSVLSAVAVERISLHDDSRR